MRRLQAGCRQGVVAGSMPFCKQGAYVNPALVSKLEYQACCLQGNPCVRPGDPVNCFAGMYTSLASRARQFTSFHVFRAMHTTEQCLLFGAVFWHEEGSTLVLCEHVATSATEVTNASNWLIAMAITVPLTVPLTWSGSFL